MSLSSIYRPNEDIRNPSLDSVLAKLAVMNTDQLKAFAEQHQDDMVMLGAAQAVHAKRAEYAQKANAPQGGQAPPVNQQVVQGMDPVPQMPQGGQGMPPQGMPPQGGQGMPPQGMPPQGMPPQGMPPQGDQLPEQQGIAQLPAPNIENMAGGGIVAFADGGYTDEDMMNAGEPVVRMADGGVPGYNAGGLPTDLEEYINEQARINSIPPAALRAVIQAESGGNIGAQSKTSSAQGLMQLINRTFTKGGGDPEKRKDPFENIRVGAKVLGEDAASLRKQLNRDIAPEELYATHVLGRGTGSRLLQADPNITMAQALKAADPENADSIISSNSKLFGNGNKTVGEVMQTFSTKMNSAVPIGTAQAGEMPRPAAPNLASQIPGQRMQAPASTYDQQNSYFGRLADKIGIPQEYQRNIANTLNATSGFTSPINTVNRAVGTTSKALEATPEMIANAQRAKQIAETQRLTMQPAKAGLEALDEASQATRAAAEAARRARGVEQDVQAARAAEQSVDAANMTSKIARTTEEGIAAIPNAQALNAAKLATASKALAGTQLAEEKVKGFFAEAPQPKVNGTENQSAAETARLLRQNQLPEVPKPSDVLAATKEVVPAKERKGFDNEDILMLGLNLMANKSPRFLSALGEAGIQTLTSKKEREKAATDLEYKDIMKKYYGSLGAKAEADASFIASGEKGRMADRQKAAALIENDLAAFRKTMEGSMAQPGAEAAKRRELTNYYFGLFGIDVPATMASTAGVAIPEGVKVTRS
jgi:hypothetical protein